MKRQTTAKLRYDPEIYTPAGATALTHKELQAEYSRLRSIARKRLERFEGTEWTRAESYKKNVGQFKRVKDIKNESEMRHLLSDVARFVRTQTSSVSGLKKQRAEAIKTFHEHEYFFVNEENYFDFTDFLDYARAANAGRLPGSSQAVEFYLNNEHKYRSPEAVFKAYEEWLEKREDESTIQHRERKSSELYKRTYKKKKR